MGTPKTPNFYEDCEAVALRRMIEMQLHQQELLLEHAIEKRLHYFLGVLAGGAFAFWGWMTFGVITVYALVAFEGLILWHYLVARTEVSILKQQRYIRECNLHYHGYAVERFPHSPGPRVRIKRI